MRGVGRVHEALGNGGAKVSDRGQRDKDGAKDEKAPVVAQQEAFGHLSKGNNVVWSALSCGVHLFGVKSQKSEARTQIVWA